MARNFIIEVKILSFRIPECQFRNSRLILSPISWTTIPKFFCNAALATRHIFLAEVLNRDFLSKAVKTVQIKQNKSLFLLMNISSICSPVNSRRAESAINTQESKIRKKIFQIQQWRWLSLSFSSECSQRRQWIKQTTWQRVTAGLFSLLSLQPRCLNKIFQLIASTKFSLKISRPVRLGTKKELVIFNTPF